jgi:hypothetical protein
MGFRWLADGLSGDPGSRIWTPSFLFRLNGDIVFTRDYAKHTLFTKKPYWHGTQGIITKIHYGPLGRTSHLDVRLPKGEFLRKVPVDYFLA